MKDFIDEIGEPLLLSIVFIGIGLLISWLAAAATNFAGTPWAAAGIYLIAIIGFARVFVFVASAERGGRR